jgi:PD-(D/E)XK nuclease superfamily
MALPGILPLTPSLKPLRRVSPSRFLSLKDCALREIWTASKQPPLLPSSPAAKLGSIIHRLLQEAGEGLLGNGGPAEIERKWLKLVSSAEEEMQQSWLERPLVPLSKTVPHYEVRKIRACNKAAEIARESIRQPLPTGVLATNRFESWVETPDGLVGGSIDQVRETSDGAILRDFKSGHVMEREIQSTGPEVKEAYKLQLKLYAALFAAKHGRWPAKLEVVPLQGPTRDVPFQVSEGNQLLEEAVSSLKQLNEKISQVTTSPTANDAIRMFANPVSSNCRFCAFRPCCEAFQTAKDVAAIDTDWPRDIWGVVCDFKILGNQRIGLGLKVNGYPYEIARIRGIDPNPERHPALQYIREGERVAIYNLKGSVEKGEFSESLSTIIYLVPARVNSTANA